MCECCSDVHGCIPVDIVSHRALMARPPYCRCSSPGGVFLLVASQNKTPPAVNHLVVTVVFSRRRSVYSEMRRRNLESNVAASTTSRQESTVGVGARKTPQRFIVLLTIYWAIDIDMPALSAPRPRRAVSNRTRTSGGPEWNPSWLRVLAWLVTEQGRRGGATNGP